MSYLSIRGGRPLNGEIAVQCAKNSVLPILAAALLAEGQCRIVDCPRLSDVQAAADILQHLGCTAAWEDNDLLVDARHVSRWDIPEELMCKMRSSVIFLGSIVCRCGQAELSHPGGCALGARPIDLHLRALAALGAELSEENGRLHCRAPRLHGAELTLPFPSVGATENAMLAACGATGTTIIHNAAREPEIVDLQSFLQKMGGAVHGAGTPTITVQGGSALHGCTHRCIGDRIAAATYLCAAAASGGCVTVTGAAEEHLAAVSTALGNAGCDLRWEGERVTLESDGHLRAIPPVSTAPYPGFPTDAQALLMAALLRGHGETRFTENLFESRYRHVPELRRMGADILLAGRQAAVRGVDTLHGAAVHCTDLRGGAALLIAALCARGTTKVYDIHHLSRGYQDITGDLVRLGAEIRRVETPAAERIHYGQTKQIQPPTPTGAVFVSL